MGGLALALAGMPAIAAVGLPLLRVDPALLSGAPASARSAPGNAQPATPASSSRAAPMPPASAAPAAAPALSAPAAPVQEPSTRAAEWPASADMTPGQAGSVPRLPTTPFSRTDKTAAPTTVTADRIEGINEQEVVAEGNVLVERGGDTLRADRLVYRQLDDEAEATGNVRLTSPNTTMSGPRLKMRLEASTGEFEKPEYTIRHPRPPVPEPALTLLGLPAMDESGNVVVQSGRMLERPPVTGSGSAAKLEFRGKDRYRLSESTFSTCAPGQRDWEIYVDTLDLDYVHEEGSGRHATVRFKDVPLLYLPWMKFSLNNQRKSGFLPPTIGSTSKSGFEVTAPWYWNIAPNMDATLTPRLMTRRGVQLNGEFRYLLDTEANRTQAGMPDKGQVRIEYLPGDRLADRDRYGYALIHTQNLGHGFSASLNVNGVSDDNYFSDLSTRISQVSQGNLLRQGVLNYAGPWYAASLNLQAFQTLQNLAKPYQRLPQLTGSAFRYDLPYGLAFNLNAEYVNFDHPTNVLGKRTIVYPQLSLPLATAALTLTPKIGVHVTHYELAGLNRPAAATFRTVPTSQNRALPIFSLDGSAALERNTDWFGKTLMQTLEPRAYYVFIPKRDQKQIPVFDSGIADFNFAQMFSENRYAGGDRIGDANELTLAVTSRLIDPASGADLLRATIGTRHYFTDQSVTLPGEKARTDRAADILATLAGQVLPRTYADVGWQYNPRDGRTERLTLGGRYRPEAGKVLNVAYRYSRDLLGQIDVSAQWPLFGGWHGVGRYNYSTKERRVIETIGGLEYDAGCWVGRFVVQRLATIAEQPTTALFFQLELNDFSRIGSNPLQLLRRSIPGYGVINQPTADPVFAEN
ncbi:LPS-assembly protein LptD [Sulfuricystis multivorans]|uniref:LPS-assembly protein LptD n=1 Tax=Sulfuricystis multivorans TaxID=2211108 RepID=UPI000F82A2F8|nr:LPS-assembly protein LptD [Sulfuricystis multivorans]